MRLLAAQRLSMRPFGFSLKWSGMRSLAILAIWGRKTGYFRSRLCAAAYGFAQPL
jgi:hypothetical protein